MFDTIDFRCRRPFKAAVLDLLKERGNVYRGDVDAPLNWFLRVSPDLDRHGDQRTTLFGQGPAGIVVRGHDNVVEWVQASLPRVLYGDNGALLRTPEDVVDAKNALNSILDKVSVPEIAVIEYNRVDLVLHFRAAVQRYLAAHRHVRHALIRNETVEYDGSGIRLPGRKATIRMYDKFLQMGAGPGDVLRLEIELRKPKLGELFGLAAGQAMRDLDFWKAYEVYRNLVCQMRPQGLPDKLDLNRLLAECEAGGFRLSNGLTAMETYRGCVDRKTYLDRRRAVKGMVLTAAGIDWRKLLPVGRLPDDLPDADPQKAGHQSDDSAGRGDAKRPSQPAEESGQACGRTQSDEGAVEAEHDDAHRSTAATSSPSSTSVTSSSATTPISVFPISQQQTQNDMNTPTTDPEDNTLEPQPAPIPTAPSEPSTEPGPDLVVAAAPATTSNDRPAGIVNVVYVAVSALTPNPKNIAIYGDEEADDELVESVRVHNILTPLHATADGVIVSGHRRLKAALKLGLEAVPVFFTEVNADPLLAEEQFLESNRNRPKNNEQLVREFMAFKRIETERARVRMLQGTPVLKSTQGGDEPPVGKARDIAARKIGMGATKAEHGEAVVLVIDRFASENPPCAGMLRDKLNTESIERAYNEAIVRGCIPNPAKERTRRATTKRKQVHVASTGATHDGADEPGGEQPGGGNTEVSSSPNTVDQPSEPDSNLYRDKPMPEETGSDEQVFDALVPGAPVEGAVVPPSTATLPSDDPMQTSPASPAAAEPDKGARAEHPTSETAAGTAVPPKSPSPLLSDPTMTAALPLPAAPEQGSTGGAGATETMVIPEEKPVVNTNRFVGAGGITAAENLLPPEKVEQIVEAVTPRSVDSANYELVPLIRYLMPEIAAMLNRAKQRFPEESGHQLSRANSFANGKIQVAMGWV